MSFDDLWNSAESLADVGLDYFDVDPDGADEWLRTLSQDEVVALCRDLMEEVLAARAEALLDDDLLS